MEVTKRDTLLECLDLMKKFRNAFSHKGMGLVAVPRYAGLYQEYDTKCQILREMIQALESEPVRAALADWQKEVMKNGPEALKLDKENYQRKLDPKTIFTPDVVETEDSVNWETPQLDPEDYITLK